MCRLKLIENSLIRIRHMLKSSFLPAAIFLFPVVDEFLIPDGANLDSTSASGLVRTDFFARSSLSAIENAQSSAGRHSPR
jgi:hypothetical protein